MFQWLSGLFCLGLGFCLKALRLSGSLSGCLRLLLSCSLQALLPVRALSPTVSLAAAPMLLMLLCMLLGMGLASGAAIAAGPAPEWHKSSNSRSDDGNFELFWQANTDSAHVFFKVTEEFSGNHANKAASSTAEYFLTGVSLHARRVVPGKYTFTLQTCFKNADGFPDCGEKSKKLS